MKTWKELKIDYLRRMYSDKLHEYIYCDDDRKLYCNIYNRIMEALQSLEDDPNTYVKVAMNKAIDIDMEILDKIILRF